jgi:murein DD-endopeptidase MepM/ murein hydrolase activator NlpD
MDTPSVPQAPKKGGRHARILSGGLFLSFRQRLVSWFLGALLPAMLAFAIFNFIDRGKQAAQAHSKPRMAGSPSASAVPKFREITGAFQKNQTMTEVLLQQGLSPETARQIIDSARPVYNLAKVKASRLYWLYFTQDGKFSNLRYPVDDERYLAVYHDEAHDCFVPVMKNFEFETRAERISIPINSSLYASMAEIGEQFELALDLADIFGSDIDFNTEIQKGDSFQVLVEKKYLNGKFVKNGAVLAASISNQNKVLTGIRFVDENGKPAYYAADGKALKRSFLKAPLKVIRITSRFSKARLHPLLKTVRPHPGVDYAAPEGTPVQSVAAGVVLGAGVSGGNGKMVKIRHAGGYETQYLHLSRIAVKSGTRIDQGEVIGYVGSSGLSTGPHLDFRISRNGSAINPAKLISPPGKPVSLERFGQFTELRDGMISKLQVREDAGQVSRAAAK